MSACTLSCFTTHKQEGHAHGGQSLKCIAFDEQVVCGGEGERYEIVVSPFTPGRERCTRFGTWYMFLHRHFQMSNPFSERITYFKLSVPANYVTCSKRCRRFGNRTQLFA